MGILQPNKRGRINVRKAKKAAAKRAQPFNRKGRAALRNARKFGK